MDLNLDLFFQKQILVPEIGPLGQKKWQSSSVLVIGLGGLGCPSSLHLALAGVGKIGLVDFDRIEISNLHRQTLFTPNDVGQKKVNVAAKVLKERCPWLQISIFDEIISESTDPNLLRGYDLVLDCTDTIASKYTINQICMEQGIPLVTASVFQTSAQFALFTGEGKPCYHCLYPNLEDGDLRNCTMGGVLGIQTGIAGLYQTSLALQFLLETKKTNTVYFMEWNPLCLYPVNIQPNPNCRVCGEGVKKPKNQNGPKKQSIHVEEYFRIRETSSSVLIDVRELDEWLSNPVPGAIPFPLSKLKSGELPQLQNIQSVFLLCESGVRSQTALTYFTEIPNTFSLIGGRRSFLNYLIELKSN